MQNSNEVWKPVKGFIGIYEISSHGRVKSLPKRMFTGRGYYIKRTQILKERKSSKGYIWVALYKNKKRYEFALHQLMAINFLNHKPDGSQKLVVDHKNNDKLKNHIENLQVVTQRYNASKDKKNTTSKYTGVSFDKSRGKWKAMISNKDKSTYLGRFKDEYDAHLAYQKALKELT